jgi:hypothetical protein
VTLENGVRMMVGAACAYEVFALTTRKVPTLSRMCRHSKSFELLLFGALIVHFHLERQLIDRFGKKGKYAPI